MLLNLIKSIKKEVEIRHEALFERLKSTDFLLECRGMYYFAKGRHAHQKRKVTGYPYFVHARGVAYLVMEYDGTVDQINAAFGHDLLEDTETSFLEIKTISNSLHCADLCSELRNNKYIIADIGKEKYMNEKLNSMSDDALLVKLADMFYNLLDNPQDKAYTRMINNLYYVLDNVNINQKCENIIKEILSTCKNIKK